jgi:hypothetical protein
MAPSRSGRSGRCDRHIIRASCSRTRGAAELRQAGSPARRAEPATSPPRRMHSPRPSRRHSPAGRRTGVPQAPEAWLFAAARRRMIDMARRTSGRTDWGGILELYDGLEALTHSPVVAINRAVALGETSGPAAGLAALDEIAGDPRLAAYQPYWAARAELLARLGRRASADAALCASDAAGARCGGAPLSGSAARASIRPNSF